MTSIALSGNGTRVAFLNGTFNEVSEQFAFEEGEGNRSLAYWRMAHENYLRRNHVENRAFDETMPLACERFKVVHTKQ